MAILSTGPIDNSSLMGTSLTQQVTVKIVNSDPSNSSTILIQGYVLNGERTLYVSELLSVLSNQVLTRNYYANFVAYEFVFTTGGSAAMQTEVSVWGKTATGELVGAHRLVASEQLSDD